MSLSEPGVLLLKDNILSPFPKGMVGGEGGKNFLINRRNKGWVLERSGGEISLGRAIESVSQRKPSFGVKVGAI